MTDFDVWRPVVDEADKCGSLFAISKVEAFRNDT